MRVPPSPLRRCAARASLGFPTRWRATLVDEHYTDPIHERAEIQANGRSVSDATFQAMAVISSDPAAHARRIKAMRELGATAVVMNVAAPIRVALRIDGERSCPSFAAKRVGGGPGLQGPGRAPARSSRRPRPARVDASGAAAEPRGE